MSNIQHGPNGQLTTDGQPVWWCDGPACTHNGTYTSCVPHLRAEGYAVRFTERGTAAWLQCNGVAATCLEQDVATDVATDQQQASPEAPPQDHLVTPDIAPDDTAETGQTVATGS